MVAYKQRTLDAEKEVSRLNEELDRLRDFCAERRTDIAEIIQRIKDGIEWDESWLEHRFAIGTHGDVEIEYDGCTTMLSIKIDDGSPEGDWQNMQMDYEE